MNKQANKQPKNAIVSSNGNGNGKEEENNGRSKETVVLCMAIRIQYTHAKQTNNQINNNAHTFLSHQVASLQNV